ncbi:hypothetical protein [Microcystis phage Mel-JY01]
MENTILNPEILRLIISSCVTLLGIVLSWYLKYKYGEYKQKKITRELSQSNLVKTILDQQLDEYKCQRSFILQRHNGGKYGTGKSMNKLSTTYESLEEGVSTEFKECQNIPMSLYTDLVNSALNYTAIYKDVDKIDDLLTKAFFSQRGTRSAIVYPVLRGDELMALVGFEWTHSVKNIETLFDKIESDRGVIGDTLSKLL